MDNIDRIEIYVNSRNQLALKLYQGVKKIKTVTNNEQIKKLINTLTKHKIIGVHEYKSKKYMIIKYKSLDIDINEVDKVFSKSICHPILYNTIDFQQKEKLAKLKRRKVARKSKYLGYRIISGSLAIITLLTLAYNVFIKKKIKIPEKPATSVETMLSLKEDKESEQSLPIAFESHYDPCSFEYNDRSNTSKANYARENYYHIIEKYAKMYGIDPNLILGMATQESGKHSTSMDGPAIGLLQVEANVWGNEKVKAYNFETKQWEIITVSLSELTKLEYNIKVACMIFQGCLKSVNYNIFLAIQTYNMGPGNIRKILKAYSEDTGKTMEEILNNLNDIGWLNNRNEGKGGDKLYLEHVFSWIGETVHFCILKPDGTLVEVYADNNVQKKVY